MSIKNLGRVAFFAVVVTVVAGVSVNAEEAVPTSAVQPDEDGYVGSVDTTPVAITEHSFDLPPEQNFWKKFDLTGEPDDVPMDQSRQWSTLFYYEYVAGSSLRPRDSSVDWASTGDGGCVYTTAGSTSIIFNVPSKVPDGARIDYLRIFYYDTSASSGFAWITSYDGAGGYSDITNVATSGDTGFGTNLSALVEVVVDEVSNAYVLNWRPNQLGSSMALCGLRVAYRLPL